MTLFRKLRVHYLYPLIGLIAMSGYAETQRRNAFPILHIVAGLLARSSPIRDLVVRKTVLCQPLPKRKPDVCLRIIGEVSRRMRAAVLLDRFGFLSLQEIDRDVVDARGASLRDALAERVQRLLG